MGRAIAAVLVVAALAMGLSSLARADEPVVPPTVPDVGDFPAAAPSWNAPAPSDLPPAGAMRGSLDRAELGYIPQSEPVIVPKGGFARETRLAWDRSAQKDWKFAVALYGWFAGIKGDSYVDGQQGEIDVTFEELFEKVNGGLQGVVGVSYRRWYLGADLTLARLEDTNAVLGGLADLDVRLDQTILDLRVGYRAWQKCLGVAKWGNCVVPMYLSVDVVAGARYWGLDTEFTLPAPNDPNRKLISENSESWWDPYIGATIGWDFAKRWTARLHGDIGGFDIEGSSNFAYQVQVGIGYRVSRKFTIFGGWRGIGTDRVEDTATGKNGQDLFMHGLMLGAGFTF
jgi:opacity protein-like surface antigen